MTRRLSGFLLCLALAACAVAAPAPAVRFSETLPDGSPLRWRTCEPIPVLANAGPLGSDGVVEVVRALDAVSAATGHRLLLVGLTDAVPTLTWARDGMVVNGWPYPAVLIGWVDAADTDLLGAESGSAVANPAAYEGVRQFVSGAAALNVDQLGDFAPGFGPGATRGNLLLHELGHLMGLGHGADGLMRPTVDAASPDGFTPRELVALRRLGPVCASL